MGEGSDAAEEAEAADNVGSSTETAKEEVGSGGVHARRRDDPGLGKGGEVAGGWDCCCGCGVHKEGQCGKLWSWLGFAAERVMAGGLEMDD